MNEKADSDLVRRSNRLLVLDALRRDGPLARIDLGRITGLSPATISSISGQLIAERLIEPRDVPAFGVRQKRGRPLTLLDLNPQAAHVLAVKLSIDGIELALADFRGEVRERKLLTVATHAADGGRFGEFVAQEIRSFLGETGRQAVQLARIGVAVQGLAENQLGIVTWSPAFSTRNIAIAEPLEEAFGIPVTVGNDANMIAEALIGDGVPRHGTSIVIFVGHGVGMGLIMDGVVFHGDTGAAAEFGHMNHLPHGALCRCGRRGCIEAYAADYGIVRIAHGGPSDEAPPNSAIPDATLRAIEAAADAGEPRASAAFRTAGEALGFGIARLIAVLNPSRIVLAGSGTRAMPLLAPHLHQAIEDGVVEELRRGVLIEVVPLGTDMIVQGTIASALRTLDREVFAPGAAAEPAPLLRHSG